MAPFRERLERRIGIGVDVFLRRCSPVHVQFFARLDRTEPLSLETGVSSFRSHTGPDRMCQPQRPHLQGGDWRASQSFQ